MSQDALEERFINVAPLRTSNLRRAERVWVSGAPDGLRCVGRDEAHPFGGGCETTTDRATAGDQIGSSVAVSGNTVVVGAYRDDARGADSGST
ncbi:MAG: FG-GAP repeat protein [Trueperaceae bacterium]|nr:MAG: FG-GAP repeat protein [Trueperaceae bacterium]